MTTRHARLAANDRRRTLRRVKDLLVRQAVTFGGIGVIVAILLIFFYLVYIVLPLFEPASMKESAVYALPESGAGETLRLSVEEQAEIGLRYTASGQAVFFRADSGETVKNISLPVVAEAGVSAVGTVSLPDDISVFGTPDGRILLVDADFEVSYPDNIRVITPVLKYPLGEDAIVVSEDGVAVLAVAGAISDENARFISVLDNGDVIHTEVELSTSFLTGETEVAGVRREILNVSFAQGERPEFVLLDPLQEWVYLASASGEAMVLHRRAGEFVQTARVRLIDSGDRLTALNFLTGGISLLAGSAQGRIHQWFPVREQGNDYRLQEIRRFQGPASAVTHIASEHRRKGFAAAYANGQAGIYYTTSHRTLRERQISDTGIVRIAMSPRSDHLLALTEDGRIENWFVHNEHPEISWSALWGKVWYESYPEPDYVWQSSSASNDFEPKFSLVPLSFGTLKAAFYAMLIAIPLAIMGAIFTAYFMTPSMRTVVKPTVEVMEALPTVILGFLAGLWLAPMLEAHLPAVFLMLMLLPLNIVLAGFAWTRMPAGLRHAIPAGWEAALLAAPILLTGWLSYALAAPVEAWLFGGNMPHWISSELGISFDQRNSLVVGIAMGFAVIPTIFSIAEDAIFGVPKHLSYGSLALGATPWQTLVRVVLPTASPGIFSALMIGLGRAVGETMIVLMATGNTPVMDVNIFQGMRTLSANIAVEMPESEVASSHYRVLFLAALVLFLFTFLFNTAAEIIRQRLRNKYSTI